MKKKQTRKEFSNALVSAFADTTLQSSCWFLSHHAKLNLERDFNKDQTTKDYTAYVTVFVDGYGWVRKGKMINCKTAAELKTKVNQILNRLRIKPTGFKNQNV